MHKVGFIVFIFGAAMFCTAKVQAQGNLNRKTITIPVARRASMMDVMREVQMQAGFMFVFQPLLVEQHVDLYLPEGTRTVQQFLDTVLLYTPIGFEERGRNIIIFRKLTIFTIQGRVTDSQTGEPLPLVSIAVKDENKGTVTDADGNYTIKVIKGDILIFSYAGRVPRRFKIESGDQLNVTLDALILDVVTINTGYYTVPHAEAVGNISTVLATEFKRAPVSNPVQALQGRVAGAFIEQTSGIPGSGYTIRIRGRNSLREEGNSPLYIIDGVPYPSVTLSSSLVGGDILPRSSPLNAIDPANIERIDVLKDADATAIYGSRGANGVVLITTKRATHEGPGAEARFYRGIGQVGHRMKLLNSAQWLTMRHEAFRNDNVMPNAGNARDLILWDTTRNTDWQDKLIGGTAHITNASLSVYGGEKHTQFLLAGDYRKETTVFPGSFDYIRASTLFNLKHGSQDGRFQLSLTPHYTYEKTILPVSDLTAQAIALPPVAPALYTEDGELNWENETWTNPLFNTVQTYEGKTSNFILNNTASYQIFPGFFARASLGYNAIGRDEMRLEPIRSYSPSQIANGITGTHIYARNRLTTWIAEPQLDYAMTTRNARVNVLIGATHQHSVQQGETVAAMGYTSDVVIRDPASAASFVQYESVNQAYKYAALFGRINYIWGKRYILNVTARRDGSSRFAKGSQFANFGAIGAGWIFSNESFLEKWDEVLSFGKLRFSYGTTGSDQIGDYGYLGLYGPATWGYDGSSIIAVRPENPGYSWELNKKMEAGLGLAFLKNRIQLDMSYYRNRSSRQLTGRRLPELTGFATVQDNAPVTVQNSGLEVLLSATLIDGEHLSWTTSANVTIPRTKLVRYDGLAQSPNNVRYMIGSPLDIRLLYRYTGIDPQTGRFTFDDGNNDELDFTDRYPVAYGPELYGGIDNVIRYRNFELSLLFQFVKQIRQDVIAFFPTPGVRNHNQPVEVMQRWQKPGDVVPIHRFTQSPGGVVEYVSGINVGDMTYRNASYIRLKSAALFYTIASPVLQEKMNIKTLRVFVQGQNLVTFTRYRGFDPESLIPEFLPPLRVLTAGVEIKL